MTMFVQNVFWTLWAPPPPPPGPAPWGYIKILTVPPVLIHRARKFRDSSLNGLGAIV